MKKYIYDKQDKPVAEFKITFEGYEKDITEPYYWHLQFPLLVNTGHRMFKIEDNHYFSESSEFGAKFRQSKGQAIAYYQQQFSSLIELLKRQLLPALEEVKLAEQYKKIFDIIEETTEKLKTEKDENKRKELINKRNDAILTLKTKWVSEVDNGKLYSISKSGEEKGLDFVLVDDLFFGTMLPDPLNRDTITKQLEELILPISTTETTKRVVKDFLYRFHMWLPTALRQTKVTYSLRVNTLKQLYSQLKLYLKFLKPLLLEISKKNESMSGDSSINYYQNFEELNPYIANLIDSSISHIKLLLIRNRNLPISRLKFSKEGFPIKNGDFLSKDLKDKEGFIVGFKDDKYLFKEKDKDEIVEVEKVKMKKYSTMVIDFTQTRSARIRTSPQGRYLSNYNINTILYRGYAWDLYECASYLNKLKLEELDLLESFIGDITILKEDLMKYIDDLSDIPDNENNNKNNDNKNNKKDNNKDKEENFLLLPFKGIYEIFFQPFIPKISFGANKKKKDDSKEYKEKMKQAKVKVAEELWKTYTIFKKSHGFIQY